MEPNGPPRVPSSNWLSGTTEIYVSMAFSKIVPASAAVDVLGEYA
jgi:hypothetical protein